MPTTKDEKEKELEQFLYNDDGHGNFMPSPRDVDQSSDNSADCYMLGVLVQICKKNPRIIKDTLITLKGEEIIVSLHADEIKKDEKKAKITITPKEIQRYKLTKKEIEKFSKTPGWNKHKANWVFAVEIAFAKFLTKNEKAPTAKLIEALQIPGAVSAAITILTGKSATSKEIPFLSVEKTKKFPSGAKYSESNNKILKKIQKHLDTKNHIGLLVASFRRIHSELVPTHVKRAIEKDPELLKKLLTFTTLDQSLRKIINRIINPMAYFETGGIFESLLKIDVVPYIIGQIDKPEFKKFKNLIITGNTKNSTNTISKSELQKLLLQKLLKQPELLIEKDIWQEKAKNRLMSVMRPSTLGDFIDETRELREKPFPQTKVYDTLLDTISSAVTETEDPQVKKLFTNKMGLHFNHAYAVLDCFQDEQGYWYVTLQNPIGQKSKIDYTKSKRAKTLTVPPSPDFDNVFNMELAHFCKYVDLLSYDKN